MVLLSALGILGGLSGLGKKIKGGMSKAKESTAGKVGRVALPLAALGGLGYLGYKHYSGSQGNDEGEFFKKPETKPNDTGNETVDKVLNKYDEIDDKSLGFFKPGLNSILTGGTGYVAGRMLGKNKLLQKYIKGQQSWMDSKPKGSQLFDLERQPKEFTQMLNFPNQGKSKEELAKIKKEAHAEMKKFVKDPEVMSKVKNKDFKDLGEKYPKIFGEKSAIGKADERRLQNLATLHKNKDLPLDMYPGLKMDPSTGKLTIQEQNKEFQDFMQTPQNVFKSLRDFAYGKGPGQNWDWDRGPTASGLKEPGSLDNKGVTGFTKQGAPIVAGEREGKRRKFDTLGSDDDRNYFNPQEMYKKELNTWYRNKLFNDPDISPLTGKKSVGGALFEKKWDKYAIDPSFNIPETHPYMQTVGQGVFNKYIPNMKMTRNDARDFLARKYNYYGDMNDPQFNETLAYRMLGGRKLNAQGQAKVDAKSPAELPGFRADKTTPYPWAQTLLKRGDDYSLTPQGDNTYGTTVGDIKGYSVPKSPVGIKMPELRDANPQLQKALDDYSPYSVNPFEKASVNGEPIYRGGVVESQKLGLPDWNQFINKNNLATNKYARAVKQTVANPEQWTNAPSKVPSRIPDWQGGIDINNRDAEGKPLMGRPVYKGFGASTQAFQNNLKPALKTFDQHGNMLMPYKDPDTTPIRNNPGLRAQNFMNVQRNLTTMDPQQPGYLDQLKTAFTNRFGAKAS